MSIACTGIGVSTGVSIAIGESFLLRQGPIQITPGHIHKGDIEKEVQRFKEAVKTASTQLKNIRQEIPSNTPSDIIEFIDTHLLMLEDKAISDAPIDIIRHEGCSAEWALQLRRDALVKLFDNMEDPYLRTRKDDLDHVVNRIQNILLSQQEETPDDLANCIVIAEDLSPADAVLLSHRGITGFVTEFGGPMSHTAILARSLGIPAVVGVRGVMRCIRNAESVILDADTGVLLADCDASAISHFEEKREFLQSRANALRQLVKEPALSRDGQPFDLQANIELPEDVQLACNNGAMGIGLYRTEFLYMNRTTPPTEEEHFNAYRDVIEGMNGIPVTIRTLDLGADKQVDCLSPTTSNPALGLRAIRLCLKEPDIFNIQLRAILRASALGPVRLMIPMLTSLFEVEQTRTMIRQMMHKLDEVGIDYDHEMPIGGMIEVPAAALAASSFARQLDFLSIGTNDLIQYTLAIDRVDDEVNYLYDPLHPAILQLIHQVILAGKKNNIPISMCGEMAGDARFIPLLIAMGLKSFSMQPGSLLDAKRVIRDLNAADLQERLAGLWDQIDSLDAANLLKGLDEPNK